MSLYSRQASDTSTSVTGHGTRTIAARLRDSNSTTETTFTIPLSLGTGRTGPTHSLSHDDRDPAITYTGSWTHASGRPWTQGDLGGNETFSRTAGDSYEYTFTGVGLDLIAPFSGNHGSATVSVDGTVVGRTQESTVTGTEPVRTVFSWRAPQGQAPAPHTVRVTVDGTPFPGSSDTFVSLDAIRYYPDTSALPGSGETEPGTVSWPRVPQKEGTSLTLHGRDALLLTADQRIGTHELYYTTSQILGAPPRHPGRPPPVPRGPHRGRGRDRPALRRRAHRHR